MTSQVITQCTHDINAQIKCINCNTLYHNNSTSLISLELDQCAQFHNVCVINFQISSELVKSLCILIFFTAIVSDAYGLWNQILLVWASKGECQVRRSFVTWPSLAKFGPGVSKLLHVYHHTVVRISRAGRRSQIIVYMVLVWCKSNVFALIVVNY